MPYITIGREPDVVIELQPDVAAAAVARHAVGGASEKHGIAAEVISDVELVVSELVSNAVQHGAAPICLRAWCSPAGLRIEVDDACVASAPAIVPPKERGGFGLRIVGKLCSRWGVEYQPRNHTKTVWLEMPL